MANALLEGIIPGAMSCGDPARLPGTVYLVGAGPGDPGLITVRGRQLLEQADVVVFDYLASPQLLRFCPAAETIYVGKQASCHTLSQTQINELLIRKAREGKKVVRLKGGDPFVFGRGGEEALALAEAGIPFQVVPGVTAAIAAPAYAGIPVTHRDFNSTFTLVTGHEKQNAYATGESERLPEVSLEHIDWPVLARLPCLAFYMGVRSLPVICRNLIDNGRDPQMPAATIQWGTTARHRTVTGTLADLARKVAEAGLTPPAVTIIGRVVDLRQRLSWFETRPLLGKTIVVTRARQQASQLAQALEELGAQVIEAPTIELQPPDDWGQVDQALSAASTFDWVIFTSQNGPLFTRQRLAETAKDVRIFGSARIAAIGQATAAAVRDHLCLRVDLCPERFVAEALAEELLRHDQVRGRRFLLLRADISAPVLRERLLQGGAAQVCDVAVYRTCSTSCLPGQLLDALEQGRVHCIAFTSSSTARNFVALLGTDYVRRLQNVKLASIGPVTTQTLTDLGLRPSVQADPFNIPGLINAIVEAVTGCSAV